MTTYSWANLDAWARKVERRKELVVKQSANNVFSRASRTATGTSRGGTMKVGFVPRADGFLAASAISSLNGSTSLSGEDAYVLNIAQMVPGDTVVLAWTAPYARKLHYDGWLWVDAAALEWQQIVSDVVAEAKRRFP